jgi:hypothetical protein
MGFQTLGELNETLMLNPISKYGKLQLDNYLVVAAEDEEADNILITLEDNGCLPLTVSWFSQEAQKVRLYQRAEGIQTGWIDFADLRLTIWTGAKTKCLVASPLVRLRDYEDLGDLSLLQAEPAALDEKAIRVFKSLIFLSECL